MVSEASKERHIDCRFSGTAFPLFTKFRDEEKCYSLIAVSQPRPRMDKVLKAKSEVIHWLVAASTPRFEDMQ